MTVREIDEPIPSDERLFRQLSSDDVDGDDVLPSAVDLQGSSVTREKYREPGAITPLRPHLTGLAVVTPGELPTEIEGKFEFFAKDVPEEADEAHAEIRPGRIPSPDRPKGDRDGDTRWRPRPTQLKVTMKLALARRFKLFRRPADE